MDAAEEEMLLLLKAFPKKTEQDGSIAHSTIHRQLCAFDIRHNQLVEVLCKPQHDPWRSRYTLFRRMEGRKWFEGPKPYNSCQNNQGRVLLFIKGSIWLSCFRGSPTLSVLTQTPVPRPFRRHRWEKSHISSFVQFAFFCAICVGYWLWKRRQKVHTSSVMLFSVLERVWTLIPNEAKWTGNSGSRFESLQT